MIRLAVAHTRHVFGEPPPLGLLTFVDATQVRRKRDAGRCFLRAGFVPDGESVGGLLAFVLPQAACPAPLPFDGDLFAGVPRSA